MDSWWNDAGTRVTEQSNRVFSLLNLRPAIVFLYLVPCLTVEHDDRVRLGSRKRAGVLTSQRSLVKRQVWLLE